MCADRCIDLWQMHSKGTVNHCGGLDKEADTKPQPSRKTGPSRGSRNPIS